MLRVTQFCLAACLLCSAGASTSTQYRHGTPVELPVYVAWTGSFSDVHEPTIERATSREQWRNLWLRHGRRSERNATNVQLIPEVDFERCMVVAVFSGAMTQSNGNSIVEVLETADLIRVRYARQSFQVSPGPDGRERLVEVTPYGIFVLPLSAKQIVVEEQIPAMFGRPPEWRLMAEIPPPAARDE